MTPEEYMSHDAGGLAALVGRGEVSARQLAEAAIERIESLNPRLNAVVEKNYARARADADHADAAGAGATAPLRGVPFLAKDMNIEVADLHLTSSCRWLQDLPPAREDSPLAARWRAAGLTLLGRTNTPEFAGEFVTEPTWRGPTRNPWNLDRSPGGSSGGAAAAVASGMVPLAHGTDSGGSIRVPAAACGLVGLKPSRGWVPVGPHHDELAGGLDCEHVLARSVRDCALMLELMSGADELARVPLRAGISSREVLNTAPPMLRIGVALTAPGGARPEEEIGAAVEEIAECLACAGHRVSKFEFPDSADIGAPAGVIWLSAIAEEIDHHLKLVGRPPETGELEALTQACVEFGRGATAVDYIRARRALSTATRELAQRSRGLDLLLLPTTATLPPRIGEIDGRTAAFDFKRWGADSYGYAPYTELFNATGQPAISLPLGVSRDGLPIGVQLAAPLGEDGRLLSLAAWLERERPWAERLHRLRQRLLRSAEA
jgi:amidase